MHTQQSHTIPKASVAMPYYEFREGVFEIDEFDCSSIFVIVGEERALVLDTGIGIGDLKWLIENKITDKPYDVVMTHHHRDHTGGAGWFKTVFIHPLDLDWDNLPKAPTLELRRDYANIICHRERKNYAYNIQKDIRPWPNPWPAAPKRLPLEDGRTFDLGGRTVTAYHCPGHTPGEMVFIDDKSRILFCGDACNCYWLLCNTLAPTGCECVRLSLDAMRRIYNMRGLYDTLYNSHHDFRGFGSPLADDVLPNLIILLEQLLEGSARFAEIKNPLGETTKIIAEYNNVFISMLDGRIDQL